MASLGRLITAMVTPFDEGENVDYEQAKRLALALINSGSDGLVVSGTTGESPTLSKEEKIRLFTEVRSIIGSQGTLIAGCGSNDTRASISLTGEAEKAGADAILLVVPSYNKPTQEGLFQHFKAIAESTSLPCILYNVPSRTVTNLSVETVIRLSQIKNIIGIKEASGNIEQAAKIIQGTGDDFTLWSGNDSDTLPILAVGGYGVVSIASHLVGNQIKQMIEAYLAAKTQEAAAIHRNLLPLVNSLFVISNPIPLKYALNYIGFKTGKPRLPLTEADDNTKAVMEAVLKKYHIDLPNSVLIK